MILKQISDLLGVREIPSNFKSFSIMNNNPSLKSWKRNDEGHYTINTERMGERLADEQVFQIETLIRDTPGETVQDDNLSFVKKIINEDLIISILNSEGTPSIQVNNSDLNILPWSNIKDSVQNNLPFTLTENEYLYSKDLHSVESFEAFLNQEELKDLSNYFYTISKGYTYSTRKIVHYAGTNKVMNTDSITLFNESIIIVSYDQGGPMIIDYITA